MSGKSHLIESSEIDYLRQFRKHAAQFIKDEFITAFIDIVAFNAAYEAATGRNVPNDWIIQ